MIMEVTERRVDLVQEEERRRPAGSEVQRLVGSAAKLRSLTSWSPCVSLPEGLKRTALYVRNNLERYKPEIYNV